jgi:hypothetical protein
MRRSSSQVAASSNLTANLAESSKKEEVKREERAEEAEERGSGAGVGAGEEEGMHGWRGGTPSSTDSLIAGERRGELTWRKPPQVVHALHRSNTTRKGKAEGQQDWGMGEHMSPWPSTNMLAAGMETETDAHRRASSHAPSSSKGCSSMLSPNIIPSNILCPTMPQPASGDAEAKDGYGISMDERRLERRLERVKKDEADDVRAASRPRSIQLVPPLATGMHQDVVTGRHEDGGMGRQELAVNGRPAGMEEAVMDEPVSPTRNKQRRSLPGGGGGGGRAGEGQEKMAAWVGNLSELLTSHVTGTVKEAASALEKALKTAEGREALLSSPHGVRRLMACLCNQDEEEEERSDVVRCATRAIAALSMHAPGTHNYVRVCVRACVRACVSESVGAWVLVYVYVCVCVCVFDKLDIVRIWQGVGE